MGIGWVRNIYARYEAVNAGVEKHGAFAMVVNVFRHTCKHADVQPSAALLYALIASDFAQKPLNL